MLMELRRPFGMTQGQWEITEFEKEVNLLFDGCFARPTTGMVSTERSWSPRVDMYETKDDLVVAIEIPGVREKEVNVSITEDLLTVKGERRFEHELKDETYHRIERVCGKFERSIPLPVPVQADKVRATYRDGVLEVKLPKVEEVKPKRIKIDIL